MELLEANGNEVVEQSYMGLYDPRCNRKPENRDCPNFKTFLEEKYDRKSWFKVRGFILYVQLYIQFGLATDDFMT